MTRLHNVVVQDQFGSRADAYVQSAVHAGGDDLAALETVARRENPERAIDLGAGGGHVAYRLASHAVSVKAVDLSAEMMIAVSDAARERGLSNIETCVASAENLPFDDASFNFLACRFSAHHWHNFEAGLRQARRVLKPGSTAVFIDVVSPGFAVLDTHLQAVELLRDPSHVRNYTGFEWEAALARAGFRVRNTQTRRLRMDYATWVERMQTLEPHRAAIRSLQQSASTETTTYYEIESDGSFTLDTIQIEAAACRARWSSAA
ncbi:class I SAM-dependent methyltransferase (plasmid) [Sphingomonas paeninsulae]|uniref:Class I SAM-dependent methyltransferase n=1 Tax=Sphingomonas paeninsulae TaxID=2319844 RepID=A0A494TDL0_SPHPE|nr:class I SAM-dependent methyltransferase [Sphingomonas paeninsulae]AYJ85362.1 class I SAM-dependent methyltransferase [Sphingomonas paeninsulae]